MRVLPEHRLAVVRLGGYVDGFELLRVVEALYRAPGLRPGFGVVWDACRVRVIDLLPMHVAPIAEAFARVSPRFAVGRTAVLGRGERDEITVRMLTLRHRRAWGRRTFVCTQAAEAAEWLGVPAAVLEVEGRPSPSLPADDGPVELAPYEPSLAPFMTPPGPR